MDSPVPLMHNEQNSDHPKGMHPKWARFKFPQINFWGEGRPSGPQTKQTHLWDLGMDIISYNKVHTNFKH